VFKIARPASEQVPIKRTETAGNDLPVTHDTFRRKQDVKALSTRFR